MRGGVREGWVRARIEEVSQSPVATWNGTGGGEFTYVQISSVDRDGKVITDPEVIAVADAPSRAKQVLRAGDVLVSLTRPNLNAVALVGPELNGAVASTGFHVIRAQGVVPGFLFYAVQDPAFVSYATTLVQGVMYPAIRPRDVLEYSLPLAPLPEQRRIVAKIEELFSELDAGVAALERAQAKLERYRASVLKAAVEGRLASTRNREPFSEDKWAPLADLIIELDQGWSPRCGRDPVTSHDAWGVIKTTAVQPLQFWDGENKTLPPHLQPRDQLEIRDGDVLVTRAGPRGRVGIACLVRATRPRLLLCDKVYRLRPIQERVTGEWLELVLNSQPLLSRLESLKTGISDSGVNLTQKRFLGLRVPVPSLKVQDSIQSSVRSVLSTQEAVGRTLMAGVARASTLRQSILKLAFEGRLVPQDPNDEPASVLLERIRASRKAEKPATKRPRKPKSRQGSLDL